MRLIRPTILCGLFALSTGCEDSAVSNECGTFEPEDGTDSAAPQDPADPDLVAACEDFCAHAAQIAMCTIGAETCVDDCRLESCDVCPGKLQPLVECRTASTEASQCTCGERGPVCEVPAACEQQQAELGFCGG